MFTFDSQVPLFNALVRVERHELIKSLGCIFVADSMGLASASMIWFLLTWLVLKPTTVGGKHKMAITPFRVIQGH